MNNLDPKIASHRRQAVLDRVKELMREKSIGYDEAWRTANADPELQPYVAAMKEPDDVGVNVSDAILESLHVVMVNEALSAAEKAIAAARLTSAKDAIMASPIFRPLFTFKAAHSTANGAVYQVVQADQTLESLSASIASQIVKAAIQGAVSCLASYITEDNARAEVIASPLFSPMIDYVEKLTGEDLRTGNSTAIVQHALKIFAQGAINRLGLSAVRKAISASPDAARLAELLKGENTPNTSADLSTAASRSTAMQVLVRKRMEQFKEPYDVAFGKCLRDPANAALAGAMGVKL